jgi:hypothetical protein
LRPILQIKEDKILATPDVDETETTGENFGVLILTMPYNGLTIFIAS